MEPGEPTPMVSIATMGRMAPIWITYEMLAVKACLQQLQDHGYFVPDFSYFWINQLEVEKAMLFWLQRAFVSLINKIEYEIFFLVIVNFINVIFFQLS